MSRKNKEMVWTDEDVVCLMLLGVPGCARRSFPLCSFLVRTLSSLLGSGIHLRLSFLSELTRLAHNISIRLDLPRLKMTPVMIDSMHWWISGLAGGLLLKLWTWISMFVSMWLSFGLTAPGCL